MLEVVLTLLVGAVCGFLFLKLKVPGGLMVGSLVGVAVFSIATGMAVIPTEGRVPPRLRQAPLSPVRSSAVTFEICPGWRSRWRCCLAGCLFSI